MIPDIQALLFNPIYSELGVPANINGVDVTVIDHTTGINVTDRMSVETIRPVCYVRTSELSANSLAVADLLGFLFVLVGIFWVVEAFATMADNPLWGLGLASGIIMIVLGFWAGGQFLATQAYVLLIFAGIWALLHGISDIINAFMIKRAGEMLAAA